MNSLLKFISRFHGFILFLLLEGVAISLLFYNSYYQQTQIFAGTQWLQSNFYQLQNEVFSLLSLRGENDFLARENARLRNLLDHYQNVDSTRRRINVSDQNGLLFSYIPAKIVNGSINRQNNFITLDIGIWDNVTPEMGVVSNKGVVGIIVNTSGHYSTVVSLLSREFRTSARLKRTGHLGTLSWDGVNYREVVLSEVPQHVNIMVGDTVETSANSLAFPEGILIGRVISFKTKRGSFHEVRVRLELDFNNLRYVNVVKSLHYGERMALEEATLNKIMR
ncbi:MAG: rod shape-determining protein MreC [Bacteroidales bacterium]